jgi:hypothetical protein
MEDIEMEERDSIINQSQSDIELGLEDGAGGKGGNMERNTGDFVILDPENDGEGLTQEMELMETASIQSLGNRSDEDSQQP